MSARAALAAALAAALLAGAPPPAAATPPVLRFESETCELGSVVQGEQPACEFVFANAGTEELRILAVEPTCGCTTAHPGPPLLRAGERGRLGVVFDSESFAGEVAKEVLVRSNDPARPVVALRVLARVEPEVEFEPAVVTFDAVQPGTRLTQVVAVTNRRAEPVRVLRLDAQPASLACVLPAWGDRTRPLVLESWDRVALEVRVDLPGRLVMPLAGECELEIEGPRKRRFRLKVLAYPSP